MIRNLTIKKIISDFSNTLIFIDFKLTRIKLELTNLIRLLQLLHLQFQFKLKIK